MDEKQEQCSVFEGAEKRLYILFGGEGDLRAIDRTTWSAILKHAKCAILNTISNSECVAYLLSESSLFVFKHALMVKTCGTTTLLHIVPVLLEHCKRIHVHIDNVFFSRSNFLFPAKQPFMHQKFENEVSFLQRYFGGHGIEFGSDNNADWHCYTNNQPIPRSRSLGHVDSKHGHGQTLEVVMFELDCQCMQHFIYGAELELEHAANDDQDNNDNEHDNEEQDDDDEDDDTSLSRSQSTSTTLRDEIDKLVTSHCSIPREVQIDSFMFRPCGYSLNGILDAYYWSIHITPEKGASFVSFETNYPYDSVQEVVDGIVRFFRPKEFSFALNWYGVESEAEAENEDEDEDEDEVHGEKQATFDEAAWKFESFQLTNCDLLTKFSRNHQIMWANYAQQTESARSDCILL